jgi:hypothetical protein
MARRLFTKAFSAWRMLGPMVLAIVLLGGCEPGAPSVDSFSDSLTFGTGIGGNGFDLVGEDTTFSLQDLVGGRLSFRLESEADIDSRFVRLYFNDISNVDFSAPQTYGHIFLSSFPVLYPGTYRVKAYYVNTVIDIGVETWVASETITVTP